MVKTEKYCLALVTAPNLTVARKLTKLVLDQRLVACVNISRNGCESHYWWKGKVCRDTEVLLLLKTSKKKLKALEKCVLTEHPYDTPEFIVFTICSWSRLYLDWLGESLGD